MKKSHKFAIAGIIVLITIVALIYTAFKQSSVYYMTVPELKGKGESVIGQGIRASGQVKDGSVNYDSAKLILNFDVFEKDSPSEILHVTYNGIKPDSFKADVQVILEGKYDPAANLFKATTLLVKCPSRYEGKTPPPGYKHEEKPKQTSWLLNVPGSDENVKFRPHPPSPHSQGEGGDLHSKGGKI